ncbi:MAG: surface lipoprotein assembly modifier, partial [Candidatus Adiutrix sp.]|nr:surface lipoprotein assembly modifier [Candidatus Adiutrix sp.]
DLGRKFERDSNWWLVGDVQAYLRGNANNDLGRIHSRESQWGRGAVGLRRLTATTLAELRFKAELFDYEWFQNVAACGPEMTFLYAATPALQLITRGSLDRRVYSRDPARNGAYYSLGQYARFFFSGRNHEFTLGAQYRGGAPDKPDYAYDGWEVSARPLFKLPRGFEISPAVGYGQDNYRGPATVLETEKRRDERLRAGVGLTYRLTETWSVECGWQYTRNRSTSALYTYDQHVATTGLAWEF